MTKTLFGSWDSTTANPGKYEGYLNQKLYQSLPHAFIPSPWVSLHFDANDTVEDSTCYHTYKTTGTSPSQDVNGISLDQAAACFNTPIAAYHDSLGRTVQSEQWNVAENERDGTFSQLDILGNVLTSADQRLHAHPKNNFTTRYNLSKEPVKTVSADGGTTWALHDVVGNLFWQYDSRGTTTTHGFDVLHRLETVHVQNDGKLDATLKLNQTVQRIVYGDSVPYQGNKNQIKASNLRGRAVMSFDQSGLNLSPFYTLHGQAQAMGKVLAVDYTTEPHWDSITDSTIGNLSKALSNIKTPEMLGSLDVASLNISALELKLYTTAAEYDALGRATHSTDPDGNITTPHYYANGWVKSTTTKAGKAAKAAAKQNNPSTPAVMAMTYNAKGQPATVTAGNGVITTYTYDPKNFRLLDIVSKKGQDQLQKLVYHHDPVGNVTRLTDNSILKVFFKGQKVEAKSTYTYDTLYRLVKATGREHSGMWANLQQQHNNIKDLPLSTSAQPTRNGQALQNYTQKYTYDGGGNLTQMCHKAQTRQSKRTMKIAADSNRLSSSQFGATSKTYTYDLHGNMQSLGGLSTMQWNYRDNMSAAVIIKRTGKPSDVEYYVYDAAGRRVRKVRETQTSGGTNRSEVIYLGGFEIRRRRQKTKTGALTIQQEWHWVSGADCRWGYLTQGKPPSGAKAYQLRYQLTNHLNSSTMELDEGGKVIAYEEYYPYGGTAIVAARSQVDVKQRYYRYSGKEADGATGLYYYGMRYYCPWLGRWTCPDPAGTIDGLNIFAFVGGNPVTHVDVGGMTLFRGARVALTLAGRIPRSTSSRPYQQIKKEAYGMGKDLGGPISDLTVGNPQKFRIIMRSLKLINKRMEKLQRTYHLQQQNNSIVKQAIKNGLDGDACFSKQWRKASREQDEHLSTTIVRNLLKGIGSTYKGTPKEMRLIHGIFRLASRLRLPTNETGYAINGGAVQHPTSRGAEFWVSRGIGHNQWDRERAARVLEVGHAVQSGYKFQQGQRIFERPGAGPVKVLIAMIVAATLHTIHYGHAPALASNVQTLSRVTPQQKKSQTMHREGMNAMVHLLIFKGRIKKWIPVNAPWNQGLEIGQGRKS